MPIRKVLDVGQCNFDHTRISHFLKTNFDVEISQAHSFDEAIALAGESSWDLVLINRLLDADQSSGMEILKSLKSNEVTAAIPVMLVSNFEDAQKAAVDAGAEAGFGKANLDAETTLESLGKFLN